MHYFLADKQAREKELGARALLLDERGCVTEASTANILIYRRTEGIVSPPKEHILPGVTVAVLEELARQIGIPFTQEELTVANVAAADLPALTAAQTLAARAVYDRWIRKPVHDLW